MLRVKGGDELDIQKLSDELIAYGMEHQMQDLYIYSVGEIGKLFFRQSMTTQLYRQLPLAIIQQLIARFKYLGEMDVGEKRKAQLGAITYLLPKRSNVYVYLRWVITVDKKVWSFVFCIQGTTK